METLNDQTLGDIVTQHYQAAIVFEKYGIDFCCQGNRTLAAACEKAEVDPQQLVAELKEVGQQAKQAADFSSWPLDLLADYIYQMHHQYIERVTPTLKELLTKICSVHGHQHPELLEIRNIFFQTSSALAAHMKKEELILFPYIKNLMAAKKLQRSVSSKLFSSVSNAIHQMNEEHLDEGEQLERMAQLSNHYTIPADACITYQTTYHLLKEYEKDMHLHIHLENNILFGKAIALEGELKQKYGS